MKHYRETDREIFLKALYYLKNNLKFKPKNLLDIGCGCGDLTLKIKDIFDLDIGNVYGIEYDKKCVEMCDKKGITCYHLDLNNDKIPFRNNEIDLITANQVLEHVFEIDRLLIDIKRVLSPNDYFVIGTPKFGSIT